MYKNNKAKQRNLFIYAAYIYMQSKVHMLCQDLDKHQLPHQM